MANNRVLSIDITNESITIVDISAQAKKQTYIHKVMIFETPEDSYEDGQIRDQERIASEIRNQLSANGVVTKNAVFVMNSTKSVNREVEIPAVAPKKVGALINANAADFNLSLCGNLQTFDNFKIQGIDVPIKMTARLDEIVVETS